MLRVGVSAMRREAAVAASVASGAAASVALGAAWGNPFFGCGRPGGGVGLTILHSRDALRYRSNLHYAADHAAL
jgi:hypothetical protein